jgi:hypothetical protein
MKNRDKTTVKKKEKKLMMIKKLNRKNKKYNKTVRKNQLLQQGNSREGGSYPLGKSPRRGAGF